MKPVLGTQLNPYHPLNQGLVGCYEFNERSGQVASDISQYRHHGNLITNPGWVPNVFGGGLYFDHTSNKYVDCGTQMGTALGNGVSALSVSLWFKADATALSTGIFNIGDIASFGEFGITIGTDTLSVLMSSLGFNHGVPFTDTTLWHHIFTQYTGSRGQVYLDNSLIMDFAHSTNLNLSGLKTFIGVWFNPTRTFDGKIDQVRIYNRELQISEITQLSLRPDDVYLKDNIESWAFIPGYGLKYTNGSTGVLANMRAANGVSGAEIVLKRTNGSTGDVINTAGV